MQIQVAENPTDQPAATAAASVASDSSAQTIPPGHNLAQPSAPTPTPENASAAKTSPTTPRKAHALPPGWEPRFWPKILHREFDPWQPPEAKAVIPDETVRLDYEFVLRGGPEEVVRVKSELVLPLALEVENLPQTDVSFPQLVEQIIVRPLVTKFRSYLQKRFDTASQAEAERVAAAKSPPPPVNMGFTIPKPANGADFAVPEPPAKPPTPKMPGYVPPSKM